MNKQKDLMFAAWCARQVQHLMTDKRSLDALDVAERYANGLATDEELAAVRAAARAAARAAWAAWAASAASLAASDAAWAAAGSASDASDAAWAAAGSASDAAWAAAGAASDAAQEKRLREVCAEIDAAIAQQKETK